jgi:CMP-N-acetylneuraminic acid synthetase
VPFDGNEGYVGLIAIVPAKASSTRVPNKNFRPFDGTSSLVDLTIAKLRLAGIQEIYLSCEDESVGRPVAEMHEVQFVRRSQSLCSNDCPIPDYIRGVVREVDGLRDDQKPFQLWAHDPPRTEDILWAQVTDPLFEDYSGLIEKWEKFGGDYDSVVVVHPRKKYLLDQNHRPMGFGFGLWHLKSQRLPYHYELPFTASILSRKAIESTGYYVGASPLWYEVEGYSVDIDTEEDFKISQAIYSAIRGASQ